MSEFVSEKNDVFFSSRNFDDLLLPLACASFIFYTLADASFLLRNVLFKASPLFRGVAKRSQEAA